MADPKRMTVDKILALNLISPFVSADEVKEIQDYIRVGYAMRTIIDEDVEIAFRCKKCKKAWWLRDGLSHHCLDA